MTDAVVIGSGPNGLAGAVALAEAGLEVTVCEAADTPGGGTRSAELFEPGVLHDICSFGHPFGAASPYFRSLGLDAHGLHWRNGEIELAHPIDGGDAGVIYRSLDETVAGMGDDGRAWRRSFRRIVERYDALAEDILGPLISIPSHPIAMAGFGMQALQPATFFARRWDGDAVRGMYAGVAAHSFRPLSSPLTAAAGSMFIGAAHAVGWPVAEGGSQAIADALVAKLASLGGSVETGRHISSLAEIGPHRVALLDTSPGAAVGIVGDAMPARVRRAFQRWSYGPGSHKVDLVVDGGIPWTNEACRRSTTVHCGGTLEEVNAAETGLHRGQMPERPFVLVGQQYLADPGRSNGDHHPVHAYAHVPTGYSGADATDALLGQIERFAPGFRDRILHLSVRSAAEFEDYNPNYVGGDIAGGANTPIQTVFRPRLALDPYRITDTTYLCSAATPPGAGVHGMGGYHAARSALRNLH